MPDGIRPGEVLLPAAIVIGWGVLWVWRRRVSRWFFVVAVGAAVACIPIGWILIAAQDLPQDCRPRTACLATSGITWWFNGWYAVPVTAALGLSTVLAEAVRSAGRRRGNRSVERTSPDASGSQGDRER